MYSNVFQNKRYLVRLMDDYEKKKLNIVKQFQLLKSKNNISLKSKSVTHFFRERHKQTQLDLRNFNKVININTKNQTLEVEGLTTFFDIVKETLKYNLIPTVVPELRNITIGGAVAGLGVESSSFKYGLVHESVIEYEILTSNGEIIICSQDQNEDLYDALPNSLGTLGYILKCKIKLIPAKKHVKVDLLRFDKPNTFFDSLKEFSNSTTLDFIDAAIFDNNNFIMIIGKFVDEVNKEIILENFTKDIYYKFLENKENKTFFLTIDEYLWRWDHDVYWATEGRGILTSILQNKLFRILFGNLILRSDRLISIRHKFTKFKKSSLGKLLFPESKNKEQLIHDLGLEIDKCGDFWEWYIENINIYPIWTCPARKIRSDNPYPLYKFEEDIVVDFGFYSSKHLAKGMESNYYDKLIEQELLRIKAIKGFHTTSFYTEEEFWSMLDKKQYDKVKAKYDPNQRFPNLYNKVCGFKTL